MNSIVIIEDHPVMRKGLSSYFIGTGRWEVIGTASSLAEAKKILLKEKPTVLLLDIQLKDGWGLDIITWYRDIQTDLPLMAVYSSYDGYAYVNASLGMGIKAYVTKNKSESELEDAIKHAMNGSLYIDEDAQNKLDNADSIFQLLTKREMEVLSLVRNGLSNLQVADRLGISRRTVDNIISCVYDKTGIKSRLELERL